MRDGSRATGTRGWTAAVWSVPLIAVTVAITSFSKPDREGAVDLSDRPVTKRAVGSAGDGNGDRTTDVSSPIVRILVDRSESVPLAFDGSYSIVSIPTGRVLVDAVPSAGVDVHATGEALIAIGRERYAEADLEIIPSRDGTIWVGDHLYRGSLRLHARNGVIEAVNVVSLSDYLSGVVDGEMPGDFPEAARQAQAIVSRSFVLSSIRRADPKRTFDVYGSVRSQRYLGWKYRDGDRVLLGESAAARAAVTATATLVCRNKGELVRTYFCACCGGETFAGPAVFDSTAFPRHGVDCDWCQAAPLYRWTREISLAEFDKAIRPSALRWAAEWNALRDVKVLSPDDEHPLPRVRLDDGRSVVVFSPLDVRRMLPENLLPSGNFNIGQYGDTVTIHGRGHGHGVGLCQWGAKGMADAGRSAAEIVRFYFPGCRVEPYEKVPDETAMNARTWSEEFTAEGAEDANDRRRRNVSEHRLALFHVKR